MPTSTTILASSAGNLSPSVLSLTGFKVGDTALDFSAPDQNGTLRSLYSYTGRYIILEYCTAWCPVCANISPVLAQAASKLWANDTPVLHIPIVLENSSHQSATQAVAASWATKYALTSPVLHPGGAPLDSSQLETNFLNFSAPSLSGPAYPTFVFLSPVFKILRVQVGVGSLIGADAWMTADELYNFIYSDVSKSALNATWELRTLMAGWKLNPLYASGWDTTLGNAIAALKASNTLGALTQLNAFNTQLKTAGPLVITFDQLNRALSKSSAIIKLLA